MVFGFILGQTKTKAKKPVEKSKVSAETQLSVLSSWNNRLDEWIVLACNALMKQRAHHTSLKVEATNEKARLKRNRDQAQNELENKVRTMRLAKQQHELENYRNVMDEAFAEDGVTVPPLASARQAQLCCRVHYMTVLDNQHHILQDQGVREKEELEHAFSQVQDEASQNEVKLLNEILLLERDIEKLYVLTKKEEERNYSLTRMGKENRDSTDPVVSKAPDRKKSASISSGSRSAFVKPYKQTSNPKISAPSRPKSLMP